MKKIFFLCGMMFLGGAVNTQAQEANIPDFSPEAQQGYALFRENCVKCHGAQALGTGMGPPLLHPFYRPGHHDDVALARALTHGVEPHHWDFGPMPVIDAIRPEDIPKIIAFIRELQRANGIK
ncbi:c-type cytochrome [Paremcibacter congregatus]|uniref:Cytochrome C n=1 Tax=Paremcibacter congregatus TaxID=2043170 RepID=A0A2G4YM30_9PROT|nr:cytochrome c [Paremcibacter congregatus]PHZ83358.1 cytochrome C [Paremcibacter congregatus]QDE28171.1 cytochrome c [Paremcibacter congregatus]